MADKQIIFSTVVRGFHIYKASWWIIKLFTWKNSSCDNFLIMLCTFDSKRYWSPTDWNFSKNEIYHTARYNHRNGNRKVLSSGRPSSKRSRFPCEITVKMPGSIVNYTLLQRHENLIREVYTEPKEEEVMGTFLPNLFMQPRQKTIRIFKNLQQSGQKISSKCSQLLNNEGNQATRLS